MPDRTTPSVPSAAGSDPELADGLGMDVLRMAFMRPYIRHTATCALQAVRDNAPDDELCTCGLRDLALRAALPARSEPETKCWACGHPSHGPGDRGSGCDECFCTQTEFVGGRPLALPARSDEGLRTTLEPESTVPAAFVTRIYQTPAEHHHSETVPCRLPMCAVAFRDAIIAAATADYAPAALAAADNTPTDPDEDGNWWINKVAAADNETTHD